MLRLAQLSPSLLTELKQKQKAGKEAAKNNFEHVAETYKDANDNFAAMLVTSTDLVTAPAEKEPSLLQASSP